MVNCKNCGAPLSLDEAVCPHCGTPNPEAQEHLKKLAQLNKDFNNAEKEVKEEVKKSKQGYNVLVILVVLLLANLVVFVMHGASYEISEKIIASKMSDAEIRQTLDGLLESGEYIEMSVFMDKFYLPYDKYGEYNTVSYLATYYDRVIENVTLFYHAQDPYSDPLVKACQCIKEFSDEYHRVIKRDFGMQFKDHCSRMNEEFEAYIKTYLKLTDEDIASIPDMSDSQLLVKVSGRLNDEE